MWWLPWVNWTCFVWSGTRPDQANLPSHIFLADDRSCSRHDTSLHFTLRRINSLQAFELAQNPSLARLSSSSSSISQQQSNSTHPHDIPPPKSSTEYSSSSSFWLDSTLLYLLDSLLQDSFSSIINRVRKQSPHLVLTTNSWSSRRHCQVSCSCIFLHRFAFQSLSCLLFYSLFSSLFRSSAHIHG